MDIKEEKDMSDDMNELENSLFEEYSSIPFKKDEDEGEYFDFQDDVEIKEEQDSEINYEYVADNKDTNIPISKPMRPIKKISRVKKVFTIIESDGKLVICGNKNIIDKVTDDNLEDICDIIRKEEHSSEFGSRIVVNFPPLPIPYKSNKWNYLLARRVATNYMNIVGFGRVSGNKLQYGKLSDMPDWWPEDVEFKHVSHLNVNDIRAVIEAILTFHNVDVNFHHLETDDIEVPRVKKPRHSSETKHRHIHVKSCKIKQYCGVGE